jgi:cbb3-type cytochrome oxidase maturation protein
MALAYIAEFGVALLFGAAAVWALAWAIRSGQFSDFAGSAASIFDEEEPVGRVTDSALAPAKQPSSAGDLPCQP